ncbi:MAG: DsbA family protein [Acidobacteriota bacterium]|nr:DsbA family protein [Acidobacteriota bacterium]
MSRTRLLAYLLVLCIAAGCKAQPASQGPLDSALSRRVEVMIRSQFNLPPDINVAVGTPVASKYPGYNNLPITISHGAKTQAVDFLISTDGKNLARFETFNLSKDPAFSIDIAGRPIRGNPDAKVTVINFDDLECPFCARMHQELFPETLEHYKNMVRFVYKDFPLTEIHPWALHAAVNANCLAAQNGEAYWSYVDYLHTHGEEISGPDRNLTKSFAELDRIAREKAAAGKLDEDKLNACLAKQDTTQVLASSKEAEALGLQGAPALFVDGERIDGAVPKEQLWMVIDRALRAAGETPPVDAPAPQPAAGGSGQ